MFASKGGYLKAIDELISDKRTNLNQTDKYGNTAVIVASRNGRLETVKHLIEKGADPNLKVTNDDTALTLAITNRHPEIVKYLLEKINNPKQKNAALIIAAKEGQVEIVNELLKIVDDPNQVNANGYPAITIAAEKGHLGVVEKLLSDKRVNPNQACQYNNITALMLASKNGHDEIVDVLIKVIDDPNKRFTYGGKTALIFAADTSSDVENKQSKVVEVLLRDPRIIVDQERDDGMTALIVASHNGNIKIVKSLLERGADPNKKDKQGFSAIDYASRYGYKECLEILKKYQRDSHKEDL